MSLLVAAGVALVMGVAGFQLGAGEDADIQLVQLHQPVVQGDLNINSESGDSKADVNILGEGAIID